MTRDNCRCWGAAGEYLSLSPVLVCLSYGGTCWRLVTLLVVCFPMVLTRVPSPWLKLPVHINSQDYLQNCRLCNLTKWTSFKERLLFYTSVDVCRYIVAIFGGGNKAGNDSKTIGMTSKHWFGITDHQSYIFSLQPEKKMLLNTRH